MTASAPTVDAYFSFRSPYSYLALKRMGDMQAAGEVHWNVKFVTPLAIRLPSHFERNAPLQRPYLLRDTNRIAAYHGIPFQRPTPDPIVQDDDTLAISAEQPYIRRLTRLGAWATPHGLAHALAQQVMTMMWDGQVKGWDTGRHLADAVARAGMDLAEMERDIAKNPTPFDALIERHEAEQRAAGHWGVPLFVFEQEPFFGQDRMDLLQWRLRESR
jgi:2-hydroxychromene-2-carboxylate isomerase